MAARSLARELIGRFSLDDQGRKGSGQHPAPTIYQLYLRSFADHSGSGEGDLAGAAARLGAVADLGADLIWLAPFLETPMVDGGYDVSDYDKIDPRWGSDDDLRTFLETAHGLGICVLMDITLNHTSDQHAWFQKSASKTDDYDDWYMWADAKPDGAEPNNWRSFFGGPAWTWHPQRQQYYLHQYHRSQPALNLHNPDVERALIRCLKSWLAFGFDGFRIDTASALFSDPMLRDNRATEDAGWVRTTFFRQEHDHDVHVGTAQAFLGRLRKALGPKPYILAEIAEGTCKYETAMRLTGEGRIDAAYTTAFFKDDLDIDDVTAYLAAIEGSTRASFALGCHDQKRAMTRLADHDPDTFRFWTLLLMAMPGPIQIYQGDELGLPQVALDRDELIDPFELRTWPCCPGRDGARTPYPWTADAPHFGFSSRRPFLPMRYTVNVCHDRQSENKNSILNFTKNALCLRSRQAQPGADIEVARNGTGLEIVWSSNGDVWKYVFDFIAMRAEVSAGGTTLSASCAPEDAPSAAAS